MSSLGRYELKSKIGAGGMGAVYQGRDTVLHRDVAVKTIRYNSAAEGAESDWLERRFLKEAQIVARLRHPNIITVHDIGYEQGVAFIVMEYFACRDLSVWAAQGKLTQELILKAVRSAASALDYAHSQGIVHRDIKPANVLMSEAVEIKITDFGIAKPISETTQTTPGMILGTLEYMAPEQLSGGAIGPATDQYSLAAMTYYLLTGRKLFESESIAELSYRIVHHPPAPATQLNPGLPAQVDRVFARALAKRPEERFPNCSGFAEALERTFASQHALPAPSRNSRRRIWLASAALSVLLCAVASGIILWLRNNGTSAAMPAHETPVSRSLPPAAPRAPARKTSAESRPAPEVPRPIQAQAATAKAPALSDIYFEAGARDTLSTAQMNVLRADAEVLKQMFQKQPGLTVRVEAHSAGAEVPGDTDSTQADSEVSIDRAEFVRQKLVALGAPGAQLVTAGLGRQGVPCEAQNTNCRKKLNRVHLEPEE